MKIEKQDAHLPDYAMVERQTLTSGVGYDKAAIKKPQIGVVSS